MARIIPPLVPTFRAVVEQSLSANLFSPSTPVDVKITPPPNVSWLPTSNNKNKLEIFDGGTGLRKDIIYDWTRDGLSSGVLKNCKRVRGVEILVGDLVYSTFSDYDIEIIEEYLQKAAVGYSYDLVISTDDEINEFQTNLTPDLSVMILKGTYNLSQNWSWPTGNTIVFDKAGGGVELDFGGTYTMTTPTGYSSIQSTNATCIGNSFDVLFTGSDLSAAEADPTSYVLSINGRVYNVTNVVDSTDTITCDTKFPAPISSQRAALYKGATTGVTASGKLTITNCSSRPIYGGTVCADFENLDLYLNNLSFGVYSSCIKFGRIIFNGTGSSEALLSAAGGGQIIDIRAFGGTGKIEMYNCYCNSSSSYIALWLLYSTQLDIDLKQSNIFNVGSGTFTGVDGGSTVNSVIRGTIMDVENSYSNMSGFNVATLKID